MMAFSNTMLFCASMMFCAASDFGGDGGAFPIWGGMFFIIAGLPVLARERGWL